MKSQSRRRFIRNGSIFLSGTLISPYLLNSCKSVNDRINFGFIGVGPRGLALLNEFIKSYEVHLLAVCDPFSDRRDKLAKKVDEINARKYEKENYKSCRAYSDYKELLADLEIDAVVIATPDHWHVKIAIEAAMAGKHIYLEKPMGLSFEQGQILRKAVHESGVIFQYGTQQRSDHKFRLACQLVRNEKMGKLEKIDAWCPGGKDAFAKFNPEPVPDGFDYDMWLGPAPVKPYTFHRCQGDPLSKGSYYIYDYAIGFIGGWGAHPLDIAQWGNNADKTSPVKYSGSASFFEPDNLFDTICSWDINCTYANEVEMRFMSDDKALPVIKKYRKFHDHGTTFFCEDGWVSVDRGGIYASDPRLLDIEFDENDLRLYESNNHFNGFIRCVREGKESICPVEAALRSDTISHLCNVMIRSEVSVLEWDPEKEEIINPIAEMETLMKRAMREPYVIKTT